MAAGDDIVDAAQSLSSGGKTAAGGLLFGFSMWGILASLLFSGIGLFYFKRGMKELDVPLMLIGAGLIVFPYFISNAFFIFLIGSALTALPWIMEHF